MTVRNSNTIIVAVKYLYKHVVQKNVKDDWKRKWFNFPQGKEETFMYGSKKIVSFLCWGKKQPICDISLCCGALKS